MNCGGKRENYRVGDQDSNGRNEIVKKTSSFVMQPFNKEKETKFSAQCLW